MAQRSRKWKFSVLNPPPRVGFGFISFSSDEETMTDARIDPLDSACGVLTPEKKFCKAVTDVHKRIDPSNISPKTLRAALTDKEYNNLANTFRNSLTEEQKKSTGLFLSQTKMCG